MMKYLKLILLFFLIALIIFLCYFGSLIYEEYKEREKINFENFENFENEYERKFDLRITRIKNSINGEVIYLFDDSTKNNLNQIYKTEYRYPNNNWVFQVAITKDTISSFKKDTLRYWVIPDNGHFVEIKDVITVHTKTDGKKELLKPESKEPYYYYIKSDKKGIGQITSRVIDKEGKSFRYEYKYVVK